jgi:hypothetical protein
MSFVCIQVQAAVHFLADLFVPFLRVLIDARFARAAGWSCAGREDSS